MDKTERRFPEELRSDSGCILRRMTDTGDTPITATPEAWVGREARLRYEDADAPRTIKCTIAEVNDRGVRVEVEGSPAFFPWGSIVRIDPNA
jgi:hypothetical protein